MGEDEPRDMWGSDEDRFRNIEKQLERMLELVNEQFAITGELLRRLNVAIETDVAAHGDDMRPQDTIERRQHFESLVRLWASHAGHWIERREAPDLTHLAEFLDEPAASIMEIWAEAPLITRIPGDWFDLLEAYIREHYETEPPE